MDIAGFDQLDAYKLAQTLARLIFNYLTGFPNEEIHALTAQIRRSSRDVGAQIAQAWAKMMAACKAVGRKINGLIFIADKMCKK
jgi:hypothetical protein